MKISQKNKLQIEGIEISYKRINTQDYINITDIAKYKNQEAPRDIIKNWLRNKNTIQLLGLWEKLYNPDFKQVEFDRFKNVILQYPNYDEFTIFD